MARARHADASYWRQHAQAVPVRAQMRPSSARAGHAPAAPRRVHASADTIDGCCRQDRGALQELAPAYAGRNVALKLRLQQRRANPRKVGSLPHGRACSHGACRLPSDSRRTHASRGG